MKEIRVKPSNEATLTNYTILNFLINGIAMSLMRGGAIVYSNGQEEYIKLLSIFVMLGIGGCVVMGALSDIFYKKHLLVLISVMLSCVGLMFPTKYGLTLKVIITSVGYCIFKASAGASVLARSEKGRVLHIGIFISSGALGMAFSIMRPIVGYYMLPFAMFAACASDKYGEEYQDIIYSKKKEEREKQLENNGAIGFSALRLLLSFVIIVLASAMAMGIFYIYFEKCMFWGADTKFGPIISSLFFALGCVLGGTLADKVGKTLTGAVSPMLAMICMLASATLPVMPKVAFLFGVLFMGISLPAIVGSIYGVLRKTPGLSIGIIFALECPAYFIACNHHIYRLLISQNMAIVLIFAISAISALVIGGISKIIGILSLKKADRKQ